MSCPLMPTVLGELALRGMSGRGFGWAGAEQDPGSRPLPIRRCAESRPMALSELALRGMSTYGTPLFSPTGVSSLRCAKS